jgi:hypothetical protein
MNPLHAMKAYSRNGKYYVSATALSAYQLCPQKFWLSRFWTSKHFYSAFTVGHFVHDCVQSYHLIGDPTIKAHAQYHLTQAHKKFRELALENPNYPINAKTEEAKQVLTKAAKYVRNYVANYKRENAVDVEKYFEVPLTLNGKETDFVLFGYLDMVVDNGDHYTVYEIKTTSDGNLAKYPYTADRMNQTYGYTLAAKKLFDKPIQLVYDVIKKEIPTEPEPLACRKTEHDSDCCSGTLVKGLSKAKNKGVTKESFESALEGYNHLNHSHYADFIDCLPSGYQGLFHRENVVIAPRDIDDWSSNAALVAASIFDDEPRVYKCFESCMGKFGRCDFHCFCDGNDMTQLQNKLKLKEGKRDSWNQFTGQ